MGESSGPIASLRDIWIMSRAAVTRSITQTKQAGTLAAPWGKRSHSLSPFWVQKAVRGGASGWMINRVDKKTLREKVEYRENQGRHRGNKDLIGAGDRDRVNYVTLLLFSYLTVVELNRISSERI